jgi:hypothetical protein
MEFIEEMDTKIEELVERIKRIYKEILEYLALIRKFEEETGGTWNTFYRKRMLFSCLLFVLIFFTRIQRKGIFTLRNMWRKW